MTITKENYKDVYYKIHSLLDVDKYYNAQIETIDNKYNTQFQTYLNSISEKTLIDGLGGSSAESSFRRYSISDKVSFEDVIHLSPTGIACGIQFRKYPLSRINEWDKWDAGYIKGFIRMDSDDKRFGEIFIWHYIKADKLLDILSEFSDKIELL